MYGILPQIDNWYSWFYHLCKSVSLIFKIGYFTVSFLILFSKEFFIIMAVIFFLYYFIFIIIVIFECSFGITWIAWFLCSAIIIIFRFSTTYSTKISHLFILKQLNLFYIISKNNVLKYNFVLFQNFYT